MENQLQKKEVKIENLRAIAILMVVFGHSIILYDSGWGGYTTNNSVLGLEILKHWINLIQMPLFFSLSGYLFFYSYSHTGLLELIKKKAKRILLPFIFIALIWLIPIRKLVGWKAYNEKSILEILSQDILGGRDCGHLWFLPCLFLIFILSHIVITITRGITKNICIINICLVVFSYMSAYFFYLIPKFWGSEIVRAVAMNWLWFCFGYVLCSWKDRYQEVGKLLKASLLCLGLIFSIVTISGSFSNVRITSIIMLITFYVTIDSKSNKLLTFLSNNSFGIYLFHSPLVYITYSKMANANPIMVVFINFIVFGGMAIVLTLLFRNTKLRIFIGE